MSATLVHGAIGTDARSGQRRTLPQLLLARAVEQHNATFIRAKRQGVWQAIGWRAFTDDVLALAHALRHSGIGKGDVVAVLCDNRPEVYRIEYAAQCLGAVVTCFYPDASGSEIEYMLRHSGARMLFAQDQEQVDKVLMLDPAAERLKSIVYLDPRGLTAYRNELLVDFEGLCTSGQNSSEAEQRGLSESIESGVDTDMAALCYTSGTSGRPKGVVLTHRYLMDNAYRLAASLHIPARVSYLSYISPAWAIEQFTGLTLGLLAPSVVHFSEKASTVQADLREVGPQFLLFTPRQWEMMASDLTAAMLDAGPLRRRLVDWAIAVGESTRAGKPGTVKPWLADRLVLRAIRDNLGLKQARFALCGGSGMAADVFRRFHALGVKLRNLYGSTEYGVLSTHVGENFNPATLGRLLKVDPAVGEPLQARVDEDGQLCIRGASGVSGYFRDPQATAATMRGEWHLTGDAVRLDADGELLFLDRAKDLRTLASGSRFPPQFIESQLRASPYIRDVIALGDESRSHVTALVSIDPQIVERFADGRKLTWNTFADLSQHPEVHELIRQTLTSINDKLDPHARVVRFASFPKELDADDGELTRSRKLRRDVIEQRYAELIEAMYDGQQAYPIEVQVRYRDGTNALLKQQVRITSVS